MPKLLTVGDIFDEALVQARSENANRLDLLMDSRFGGSFSDLKHEQKVPYDVAEYLSPPIPEEELALTSLLDYTPLSVLDVGAGSGRISLWLQDHGLNTTACDTDPACVHLCQERGVRNVTNSSFEEFTNLFQAVILMGGGIPLEGSTADTSKQVSEVFCNLTNLVQPGGYLLFDSHTYKEPDAKEHSYTKVTEIRFIFGSSVSIYEYYAYPSREKAIKDLEGLNFRLLKEWEYELESQPLIIRRWFSIWQSKRED